MKKLITCLIFFLHPCMTVISAQENNDFNLLNFCIDGIYNVHKTKLDDYWKSGKAVDFSVTTPYSSGLLGIGIAYSPFTAEEEELPDFKSFHIYLQWQKEFMIYKTGKLLVGPRVGMFQMKFDKTEEVNSATDLLEHEVTIGVVSQLVQKVSSRLNLNLTANYFCIFTKKKINLIYIEAGLSYSIETPLWLKNFLR
ncbi:MAG: hypothetical protein PVH88_25590 [Ignavibacteria bacterium]